GAVPHLIDDNIAERGGNGGNRDGTYAGWIPAVEAGGDLKRSIGEAESRGSGISVSCDDGSRTGQRNRRSGAALERIDQQLRVSLVHGVDDQTVGGQRNALDGVVGRFRHEDLPERLLRFIETGSEDAASSGLPVGFNVEGMAGDGAI